MMKILIVFVLGCVAFWYYRRRKQSEVTAKWARPFSLYYLAHRLHLNAMGPIPNEVSGLMDRPTDFDVSQPFLVSLSQYLEYRYKRARQPSDIGVALAETRKLLASELQEALTPLSLERFVRAMHEKDTGKDIDDESLFTQCKEITNAMMDNTEIRDIFIADIIRYNTGYKFKQSYGIDIREFIIKLLNYNEYK